MTFATSSVAGRHHLFSEPIAGCCEFTMERIVVAGRCLWAERCLWAVLLWRCGRTRHDDRRHTTTTPAATITATIHRVRAPAHCPRLLRAYEPIKLPRRKRQEERRWRRCRRSCLTSCNIHWVKASPTSGSGAVRTDARPRRSCLRS